MKTQALKYLDRAAGSLLARSLPRPAPGEGEAGIRRLLIIRPGGIGDAVHLVPALLALKNAIPDLRLDILAERRNADAFELSPVVDEVLCYDSPRQLLQLFRRRYGLVVDTEQWHRLSAVVARLVRAKGRAGFATNERARLFGCTVDYSHEEYEAESFLRLLRTATGLPLPTHEPPFLSPPLAAVSRAGDLLKVLDGRDFVTLFPGASIPERRWGAQNFRLLAAELNRQGFPVVVVGSHADREGGEEILEGLHGRNLAGRTTLAETAAVIDRSALLVGGDSGVLHLAVGLGVPTVSLFGPGIAAKWAPRGPEHIVLNKNLPCSPCTRFGYTPRCPRGAECLQSIAVEEVVEAVFRLLERNSNRSAAGLAKAPLGSSFLTPIGR